VNGAVVAVAVCRADGQHGRRHAAGRHGGRAAGPRVPLRELRREAE
jgi:hypothetical protein